MKQLLLLLLLFLLSFFSSSSLSVSLSPLTVLSGSVQSFFFLLFWVLTSLAIVESSFCNLRPLDHTTISFYSSSHSHQLDLSIMVFADCCFSIFLSALFPIALSTFFPPSLSTFCFCLCTLESSSLLTLLCVMDNLLSCHPLNTCCQLLSFENVIGFCFFFSQIF